MTMWAGRLDGVLDRDFEQLNSSLSVDIRLVREDVEGSIAWVHALAAADVLAKNEAASLETALLEVCDFAIAHPDAVLASGAEDIHTWVGQELIDRLGDLGKKLHTGRSRNDQVATDLRLWTRRAIADRRDEIRQLQQALITLGERECNVVLPGYTHLQQAQPILFAHWCLAYFDMFLRDDGRFEDALRRVNRCPLGSGALAGTAFPIDRTALALRLGFDGPTTNSLDAVSDRDFVVETLSAMALCAMHLSRLAEDLIFYATTEAGFVTLADAISTGSSMMPQKKNPDALELVRGKAATAIGAWTAMATTLKGLPLSYNKDLQEDKTILFKAMDDLGLSLRVICTVIGSLQVNSDRTMDVVSGGYANATDLADQLTLHGVPFRDAHAMTGRIVRRAAQDHVALERMSTSDLLQCDPAFPQDLKVDLTIDRALAQRNVVGGTAPDQVAVAMAEASLAVGLTQRSGRPSMKRSPSNRETTVRTATLGDVDGICRIVDHWAQVGENLPRTRLEIQASIESFSVACDARGVIGCGSIVRYTPTLAEIRSLGVDPDCQQGGVGAKLVEHLIEAARAIGFRRVFALTRVPKFFARCGFHVVSVDTLPEKVFKDCVKCMKRDKCDEIAVLREIAS